MAAETGISSRAIKKHLANLQAAAVIQRIGPDNGGKWVVVEQDMSEKQQICWQQNTVYCSVGGRPLKVRMASPRSRR